MNSTFTRESLQNLSKELHEITRREAIKKTVEHLQQIILFAATGDYHQETRNEWKRVNTHKIMIPKECFTNTMYVRRNPYYYSNDYIWHKDILPQVIEELKQIFVDVDFRLDEMQTYLLVDWS